jgi:hypothetical protein
MLHDVDLQAGEWGPIRSALVINIGEIMRRLRGLRYPGLVAMTDTATTTAEGA